MIEPKHSPIAPLFVPGSQPERFNKAIERSAGDIILDLEDAVAINQKQSARSAISAFLEELGPKAEQTFNLSVRVNAPRTSEFQDDLEWLKNHTTDLDYVVLPMVETSADVSNLYVELEATGTPLPILAQIETARGVLNAPEIATAKGLITLVFGAADYANEIGVSTDGEIQFIFARSALVNACAAQKLIAPLDSPYFDLANEEGLSLATKHARDLGFGGKLCIHPKQIAEVSRLFVPSREEIDHAKTIVSAFENAQQDGVASIKLNDGTFVDYPVFFSAQKLLKKASVADE